MIREVDLVSYLPPFIREYEEQCGALEAENPEFDIAWNAADQTLYNSFIETADEDGISHFEKILGILPFAEDTLEVRRARVRNRWANGIPYTLKTLIKRISALCGNTDFSFACAFSQYQLNVLTSLESFGQVEELEHLLETMLPCNIHVHSQNQIDCTAAGGIFLSGGVAYTEDFTISNESI